MLKLMYTYVQVGFFFLGGVYEILGVRHLCFRSPGLSLLSAEIWSVKVGLEPGSKSMPMAAPTDSSRFPSYTQEL